VSKIRGGRERNGRLQDEGPVVVERYHGGREEDGDGGSDRALCLVVVVVRLGIRSTGEDGQ